MRKRFKQNKVFNVYEERNALVWPNLSCTTTPFISDVKHGDTNGGESQDNLPRAYYLSKQGGGGVKRRR